MSKSNKRGIKLTKRTHSTATAEEIANWTMPEATPEAVRRAEELGRQLAPREHDPTGEKRKVFAKTRLLQVVQRGDW